MISIYSYLFRKFLSRPAYLVMFVCMLFSSGVDKVIMPFLFGQLVEQQAYIPWIMVSIISVFLFSELIVYRIWHFTGDVYMYPRIKRDIIVEAMRHLMRIRYIDSERNPPAELVAKVESLEVTGRTVEMILQRVICEPIGFVICLYICWKKNPLIFLSLLAWMVNFFFCLYYMSTLRKFSSAWADITTHNTARMVNIMSNIFNIKIFSSIEKEVRQVEVLANDELRAKTRLEGRMFTCWFWIWASYFSMFVGVICIMWQKNLPISDFIFMITLLDRFAWQVMFISYFWSRLMENMAKIRNGLTIFDLTPSDAGLA